MDNPIKVENGTDNINENGGGDFGGGMNGDVKKEHKSEHKSKDHKSKKNKHKDKERSRDHKSSHKDKHRSKDHKSHKSSSKDKDKDRQSSSSRKDGDKDRHREKDRHRDKDKHREDKDRHREDKGRHREDKEKHMKDKDKHREEEEKHRVKDEVLSRNEEPKLEVKDERPSPQPAPFEDSQDFTDGDDEPRLVIKEESFKEESEDDAPLSVRTKPSVSHDASDSEEDKPLSARKKVTTKKKRKMADSDDEFSRKPVKKAKKESVKRKGGGESASPTKKKKEEEGEVWKWWEEKTEQHAGEKWRFLEHKGPLLALDYELLPSHVKFFYNGQQMKLSQVTEEVATFYSKMLDHDYTTRDVFNQNFFKDWRKSMTDEEREKITHLKKCDFTKMAAWFKEKTEERKAMSKEDRKKLKETNEAIVKEYGFCALDGHTEKIGNFRVEPPGLFRGRGDHPKQGMVKRRILAKNVIINCSKDSVHPKPPPGQRWKEVRHDNSVTWLASWTENIQGQIKYVMLNAASRLKGEKDWQKYEVARRLNQCVNRIRESYKDDFKSKEMRIRQRAVAMYFIDKLALRAGNEKDEDQADTVGCCSLRVEHIKLEEELNGKAYVVVFDFLGKDSIRYYNEIPVEKRVFKNLQLFTENKEPGDDLFDRLNTTILNKHLTEQMDGLTAKVFRTYNASRTLQEQLDLLTEESMSINEKILAYNRANRAVAILCNHQRAVPKTFEKSMENLMKKIADKKETLSEAEKQLKAAKRAAKSGGSVKERSLLELKRKAVDRIHDQLKKLELSATDKEENKEISLGTSKLNYLDPRISVAWCKKWDVPIEKVYNKTQRDKFRWAIDMAGPEFVF